jgi:hypothetical protein
MQLTNEHIIKFQALYRTRFGKDINREKAVEKGIKLLRLMEIIYKPMTKDEYDKVVQRQAQINK